MKIKPGMILLAGLLLALLLAGAAAVVTVRAGHRSDDVSSARGVSEAYLRAVIDGRGKEGAALLRSDSACDSDLDYLVSSSVSAQIVDEKVTGDRAAVKLLVTERPDPFSVWTHSETFHLERAGGTWLITGGPWPFYDCE